MVKKLFIMTSLALAVLGVAGSATAATLLPVPYYDVNKSADPDDDYLCWAATASNMLFYQGWTGGFGSANDLFDEFKFHWSNEYGHAYWAIDWWFTGDAPAGGDANLDNPIPGGGFYQAVTLWDTNAFYGSETDEILNYMVGNVAGNRVWGMLLGYWDSTANKGVGVHVVTGWGYDDYTAGGSSATIYITDSDLGGALPTDYAVSLISGRWYLPGYQDFDETRDLYIMDSVSLEKNNGNPAGPHTPHIPEPATLLLLGSGLLSLCLASKKIRKS